MGTCSWWFRSSWLTGLARRWALLGFGSRLGGQRFFQGAIALDDGFGCIQRVIHLNIGLPGTNQSEIVPCPFFNGIGSVAKILDIGRNGCITNLPLLSLVSQRLDTTEGVAIFLNAPISKPETVLEGHNEDHEKEQQFDQGTFRPDQKACLKALRPA